MAVTWVLACFLVHPARSLEHHVCSELALDTCAGFRFEFVAKGAVQGELRYAVAKSSYVSRWANDARVSDGFNVSRDLRDNRAHPEGHCFQQRVRKPLST